MIRSALLLISLSFFISSSMAEEYSLQIIASNNGEKNKVDEPVVLNLNELRVPFEIKSAIVLYNNEMIASQLDDLDGDNIPDELAMVLDVPASSKCILEIRLSSEKSERTYPSRVYAEMLLSDKNGKHQHIKSLTTPGNSDVYNLLHHHGPAFESELVAYRIYFDKKQTVDIYGKFKKQLEIEESQFYPTDEQLARGFGDDVLRVSGSCGLGALKGWSGNKALHIEPVDTRTETVLATGPVRTIVDVNVKGWEYQGSKRDMNTRYILYAGHRDCEVQIKWDKPLQDEIFAAGIQRIKESVSFSDKKGLYACWGTDWPVNDTIKYAKETVGLAISLPEQVIGEETGDAANYLYTIKQKGLQSFTYHINFTSRKETFGYDSPEKWFAYVAEWKKELLQPLHIEIKK